MKITIEIDSKSEMDKLSALLETFNINTVNVIPAENAIPSIKKGDKKIKPESLFGIWADKPRSLEDIRVKGWC